MTTNEPFWKCYKVENQGTTLPEGVYQLKKGGKCLYSDLSMGDCGSGAFKADTSNRSLWYWNPSKGTLNSWKEDKWNQSMVGLYVKTPTDPLQVTDTLCYLSDNCKINEDITEADKGQFILTSNGLRNANRLCYDINTLLQVPCTGDMEAVHQFSGSQAESDKLYHVCNGPCGSTTKAIERGVNCQMWPVPPPDNNPTSNIYDCCMGEYVSQYPDLLQSNVELGYITPGSGGASRSFTLPHYDKNILGDNLVGLWLKVTTPGAPLQNELIPIVQQSSGPGPGATTITLQRYPVAPLDAVYHGSIYKPIPKVDSNKCNIGWCPWSDTCKNGQAMVDYCAGMDPLGHPRILTEANCKEWCGDLEQKGGCTDGSASAGGCGDAAAIFCQHYPNHPSCGCHNYGKLPFYQKMKSLFEDIKGCDACASMPPPQCWAPICTSAALGSGDPDGPLQTNQDIAQACEKCKGLTINICKQAINAIKTHGNVDITDNEFIQICGEALPKPDPTPTPGPGPAPPGSCVYGNWGDWSNCVNGSQKRVRRLVSGPESCQKIDLQTQSCTTPSPPSPTPSPPSPTPSTGGKNLGLIIGISVGTVVIVAVVITLLYRRRKATTSQISQTSNTSMFF
jgi:hypothetical protein